jgi:hypothetical protein
VSGRLRSVVAAPDRGEIALWQFKGWGPGRSIAPLVRRCPLRPLRLEEFDWVAGWILDQDLAAARAFDGLTSEPRPLGSEIFNSRVEIGNHDLEPIPASRLRHATGLARAACAGLVEKQSQVILRQTGEARGGRKLHVKTEAIAVEVDRLVDVCDEVPQSRLRHVGSLRFVFATNGSLA